MAGRALAVLLVVWAASVSVAGKDVGSLFTGGSHAQQKDSRLLFELRFQTADNCFACHNGLTTAAGEDVSIGADWRASMMGNSSRDPYWQAAVRRETMDHPQAQAVIEDECSICHMPMTTFPARAAGGKGRIFIHLPIGRPDDPDAALAADGVSCTVCHQLSATGLGEPRTFTGKYTIDTTAAGSEPRLYGPFAVDAGRARVMRSSAGFMPAESTHMQQSELCASCHTLFTHAIGRGGEDAGTLPEQTPYLEWQQSEFRTKASCQSCHMPVVEGEMPIAAVLGQPRAGFSRHSFRGGNFFMLRMLNRYRDELDVRALPREMEASIQRTLDHLEQDTARVSATAARLGDRLEIDVDVANLAGHKFPTAYPSRRAWLHVSVADGSGRILFESGAFQRDGRVAGNDNDADAAKYEPHYTSIDRPDQVQVYESVMGDSRGAVTTGLLSGARYLKDNRLLPRGFNKTGATADVAVHGDAGSDADFLAGGDRVRYVVDTAGALGPFVITVKLWFQPIGFRWAENLRPYDAPEPRRFVRYFDAMASASATVVAEGRAVVR